MLSHRETIIATNLGPNHSMAERADAASLRNVQCDEITAAAEVAVFLLTRNL